MTHLDEMELRSTIERRDGVIRILENDFRKAERENRELREKLAEAVEVLRRIECRLMADPKFFSDFIIREITAVLRKNKDVRRESNATTTSI